eukprot:scaffold1501_cov352-Pavlova_lutheri.AAC.27
MSGTHVWLLLRLRRIFKRTKAIPLASQEQGKRRRDARNALPTRPPPLLFDEHLVNFGLQWKS